MRKGLIRISSNGGRSAGRPGLSLYAIFTMECDTPVDDNGHGTLIVCIIVGKMYGIEKNAQVRAVKIFSSEKAGSNAIVVAALEWAVKDGAKHTAEDRQVFRGGIIKMNLGSVLSLGVNDTTDGTDLAGELVTVATGNVNLDSSTSCRHFSQGRWVQHLRRVHGRAGTGAGHPKQPHLTVDPTLDVSFNAIPLLSICILILMDIPRRNGDPPEQNPGWETGQRR